MADDFGTPTRGSSTSQNPSTTDVAREQAAGVGQGAAEAGRRVAGVAGEQTSQVASEAADQARNLYHQTRQELQGQAASQQERLAGQIRSLSSELGSMTEQAKPGVATDLIREVSGRADTVAGWLENRDPGSVLNEVTDFARRRPGAFLAIAAGTGFVVGRLTRGAVSAAHNESQATDSGYTPVAGSTGAPVGGYAQPVPAYEPYERYDSNPLETTPYEETVPGTVPGTIPGTGALPDRRAGL